MIPIADESPRRYIPYINYFIIAVNILVYFKQPGVAEDLKLFFYQYGLVPSELIQASQSVKPYLNIFTSMFIHGDFFHLAGNILYLWIFGDNVEYILGHARYFVFYFVVGIGAAALHIIFTPDSIIPMVGASGAISGILGAYLLKFPRNRVSILLFFIFIIRIVKVPAFMALSLWFLFQLYNGYFTHVITAGQSGVAWFAHVGGFISGFLLIKIFEWYPRYK